MVGASRTERSAARQVGNIVEWTKVLRCESVQDFVDENGNLVLNLLRHMQPVDADKRVGDTTTITTATATANVTASLVLCLAVCRSYYYDCYCECHH